MTDVITFNTTELTVIERNGVKYVTAADLAKALGYARTNNVTQLYLRNKHFFRPDEVVAVNLTATTAGSTYLFSPTACRLIALKANTPKAEEFTRWVLDVLDRLDHLSANAPELFHIITYSPSIDASFGAVEIVEDLAQTLCEIEAPQPCTQHQLNDFVRNHWRSYVPRVTQLLKKQGIPTLTLAKLRAACRVTEVPVVIHQPVLDPKVTPNHLRRVK